MRLTGIYVLENAWWESGNPATLNAKNSVAEWSWESHFPMVSQRQEGVGVGACENGKGCGRTQDSAAGELDLYPGSTNVNVSQSLTEPAAVYQLQYKVISVTPTGYEEH